MIEENYFNRSRILSTAMTFTVLVSILTPLFLGMSFFLCGDAVATPHSGPTTGDETWLAVNNPHVVTADFTVGLGHNLTLEPGVRVELVENTTLRVKGRMIANGTPSSIITFTSDSGKPKPDKYWEGIIIESTSIGSIINCTEIEFANYGIYCYGSNPKITNNTISSSWFAGIYTDNANPLIYNNTITQNDGWGIKIEHNSMPMVKFNQVTSNGYDGIYVDGNSRPLITNNTVTSNFNNGVKCMDRSNPRIIDNKISSNMNDGIYVYSASPQILNNSITANNHTGIRVTSSTSAPVIEGNDISSNLKNGVVCLFGAHPNIKSNLISDNDQEFKDLYPAIYIDTSNPSVSYNNISQNNAHGIYIINGAQPVIKENTIENNYLGIYVESSAPQITGNTISSNTHDGIFMSSSSPTLAGVVVSSNGDDGIHILSSSPIIEKCTISSNTDNGVQSSSSNFTISNSNISLSGRNDFDLRDNSHTYALNTSFDNTSITFNDAISTLEVQWYLSVIVLDSRGDRISGAQVVVNDVSGAEIYNGTSIGGGVEGIPTTEYVQDQAGKIMYTPHNVTASKEGSTAYSDSDPIMDSNKEVVVTFPIDFKISTPTGLKVFSLPVGHTLNITWDPNLEYDLTGYILYISTNNISYDLKAKLNAENTFYIDINLIDGKSYYYKISATNGTDESALSEQVMGIPWDIVPPIAPANLTVGQGIKGDSLFLTWDNVIDDDLMGYIVYRAQTPDEEYESIAKLGPQTQYLDTGLAHCTTYYYKITAIDEVPNESGFSNIASGTTLDSIPPSIPTGLIALLHNETALRIMWNPNKEEDLDHY
ncbi:right-handed parallel beta-helix repeat-containing protein, partial [Candidatus Pacearchaeota archaeon]|nr:right-handed parallel beta-helix repeat-containing protein [Candidatus Pacearchaeota archaeon]